jgi:nucleotide-binding universal stress UspA family protein
MTDAIILVPLDGSEQALAALPVATVLGEIEGVPLHILHVAEREPVGEGLRLPLWDRASLLDAPPTNLRVGAPAMQILQVARELKPRLIVMCRHASAEPGKMLGRTAMKVFHDSPCPVVLVPPERGVVPWHLHHVLVPHDGTPTTSAALKPAAQLAELARAELLVAHVTDTKAAPAEPGALGTPRYVDQPQHEWPAWSTEFIKRLACVCPLGHLHVRVLLAHGDAAAEILRLAEGQSTDLIVLAWRGKWENPRAAIVKGILRQARCPIMVVRA